MRLSREDLPGALALTVTGRAEPPSLRMEMTDGRRMLLRQDGRAVLLARVDADRDGVALLRRAGYRSPLPPLRADEARRVPDRRHGYAGLLADAPDGPLHDGRWLLAERSTLPYGAWRRELPRTWPEAYLDWVAGWNGVVPLRPLSAADAPRVKAYRRQAREGVLPPVLLWWVSAFDGWVVLDGHDRAVAALAEDQEPASLVLMRGADDATRASVLAATTAYYEERMAALAPEEESARRMLARSFGAAALAVPYDEEATRAWPIPGGPAEWDTLMLQFRHEHDRY
ncbi:hypothetical protein AB0C77_21910 [Streptomyces sp. NPDC048629]|uniref:hypothetical protein n=1 Tax=Streptomyces sp. NPDC048629 TaxID=3154824 RepID=UPI00342E7136